MQWRRQQPALRDGDIRFLDAPEPVLAFVREHEGRRLLLAFNLSPVAVAWDAPEATGEALA
jgi:alpha-glucosidase